MAGDSGSRKLRLCSYWQYSSRQMRCNILNSRALSSPGCDFSLLSTLVSSLRLTHNRHCQLSLSSGSELIAGIWQFWWNTLGHLSQHINSPPSRHTAHQSSLGSSFCSFLLLTDMISLDSHLCCVCLCMCMGFGSVCICIYECFVLFITISFCIVLFGCVRIFVLFWFRFDF